MYKDTITQKNIVVRNKFCDICGEEIQKDMACSIAQCEQCKRDLCEKCIAHEDSGHGDYRTVYCAVCWGIGEDYRNIISHLENQIDELYNEWAQKCKM